MRKLWISLAIAGAIASGPVKAGQSDKPITNRDPGIEDVAKTPINDLNVGRDNEIPAVLITATQTPYALDGMRKCSRIIEAVEELDSILGPDLDLPQDQRARISAGRLAKTVVASFIPFRGIIREISGANDQDRKVAAAIQAGLARRGFLKGVGAARGCKYPGSPATAKIIAQYEAELAAEDARIKEEKAQEKQDKKDDKAAEEQAEKNKD